MKSLNSRLPENMRLNNPTGHSGRHTYASISMNADGGDSLATSAGTNHKDPKSLKGYVAQGPALKMKAAQTMGKSLLKKRSRDEIEDGSEDEETLDG